jgi:predicted translin family RNA/ssDNA-binding protein
MTEATVSTLGSSNKRARSTLLMDQFTTFRSELDQSQAQRERIVKISRDITALSKQMIFALHRVASGKKWQDVKKEVEAKLRDLRILFRKVQDEVKGEDFSR